ncbi:glycosyltransferase family 4 protein [Alkalibacterium putridalgicola]|uniref:glycosyltransferase family 4 protein n=1 Tax=Alkalibacterium putridalgicola TaxID=426703 RepID=UPI0034CD43D8
MNRICIVTRDLSSGGAERVISNLANYLVGKGKSIFILTLFGDHQFYQLHPDIEVISFSKEKSKAGKYIKARNSVNELQPDIVLAMPEEVGIYLTLTMIGSKVPVIISERNNPSVMPSNKMTRILRYVSYSLVKGIIFQTSQAMEFFPNYVRKKGEIILNPIDIESLPDLHEKEREKVIVSVGRLEPQKNFSVLLEAFSKLVKEYPEYRLVIYGEGSLRGELEKQISELFRDPDLVSLPGRVSNPPENIKDASMFVLSSDYEGLPNALIESMAMGLPVISTDCPSGGPRELIENEQNGILVPVNDSNELHRAMKKIIESSQFSEDLGKNALCVRKQLDPTLIYNQWHQYLEKFVAE